MFTWHSRRQGQQTPLVPIRQANCPVGETSVLFDLHDQCSICVHMTSSRQPSQVASDHRTHIQNLYTAINHISCIIRSVPSVLWYYWTRQEGHPASKRYCYNTVPAHHESTVAACCCQSGTLIFWCCWLDDRKGIPPVKVLSEQFLKVTFGTSLKHRNSGKMGQLNNECVQMCVHIINIQLYSRLFYNNDTHGHCSHTLLLLLIDYLTTILAQFTHKLSI